MGLRNLPTHRLTTALMVVSAAMMVFGLALAPADNASTATFVIWIAGALALIGIWVAVGVELARRFSGRTESTENTGDRSGDDQP